MLIDYITIDNIFANPIALVEYAKQQTYYTLKDHPIDNNHPTGWTGKRTDSLNKVNPELVRELSGIIGNRVMQGGVAEGITNWDYKILIDMYFHYLTAEDVYTDIWPHKDIGQMLAGVIYLSPSPQADTGTVVYKGDNKIVVPNEFNKLVLYRADYLHYPQGGFGSNVNDARLTLTFFIKQIQVFAGTKDIAGLV